MQEIPRLDLEKTEAGIEDFIEKQVKDSGTRGVVLGMSGGLDSACVAALAAKALGKEKVLGIQMPEETGHNYHHYDRADYDMIDARELMENLGIKGEFVGLNKFIEPYRRNLKEMDNKTMGNVKARTRMAILYTFANKENRLVAGTGDKSEILAGYFTKYGDGGVDMLPIGNLYKTQVREVAKRMGVPDKIIQKPSSPCLWDGQTAEGELGIRYEELDKMLYNMVDLGKKPEDLDDVIKARYVQNLVKRSAHKRNALPVAEVVYRDR